MAQLRRERKRADFRLSYNMGSDGTTVASYLDKDGKLR